NLGDDGFAVAVLHLNDEFAAIDGVAPDIRRVPSFSRVEVEHADIAAGKVHPVVGAVDAAVLRQQVEVQRALRAAGERPELTLYALVEAGDSAAGGRRKGRWRCGRLDAQRRRHGVEQGDGLLPALHRAGRRVDDRRLLTDDDQHARVWPRQPDPVFHEG